jgi:hypothetical protein
MGAVNTTCTNDDCGDRNDQDFIVHLVGTRGGEQTDRIVIANRRAIQAATNLYKRGFRHVMCRTAASNLQVAGNCADSLWIINAPSERELRPLIAMFGPDLRAAGTLVVSFEVPISSSHVSCLRRALVDQGFAPVREEIDSAGRPFLLCGP